MNLQPHDWAQLANTLKSVREDDFEELEELPEIKACGANKPGGGGFATGNTCARGSKGGTSTRDEDIRQAANKGVADAKKAKTVGEHKKASGVHAGLAQELSGKYSNNDVTVIAHRKAAEAHKEAAKNFNASTSQAARTFSSLIPKIR